MGLDKLELSYIGNKIENNSYNLQKRFYEKYLIVTLVFDQIKI